MAEDIKGSAVPKTNMPGPPTPIQNTPIPKTTTEMQLPSTPIKADVPTGTQPMPSSTPIQNTQVPVTTTEKQLPDTPVKPNEKI